MPQRGFVINGRNVAVDDALAMARRGELPYPPALLRVLFSDRNDQVPTPSALDGCLRRFELQRTTDYYTVPEKGLAAASGTGFHAMLDHAATEEAGQQEQRLTAQIDVPGLGTYTITGTADHVDADAGLIMDWKTKNYIGTRFEPSESHIWQVNVYAWLWAASHRNCRPLDRWRIVYIAPNMSPAKVVSFEGDLKPPGEVADWIRAKLRAWALPVSQGRLPYPQDSFFEDEPKRQGLCNFCPVRKFCELEWEGGR